MSQTTVATKFEILIVYNGVSKPITVEPHEQVQAVLKQAIHLFSITQNPHLLSLFKEDGTVVSENQSVADAGIKPGERLALRPNAVKGG
jgi:Tfp pilus assembly pilus retraction ATPase PilT